MLQQGGILPLIPGSDAADRRPLQSDGCDFGEAQGSLGTIQSLQKFQE
jgi:hypothetical protein